MDKQQLYAAVQQMRSAYGISLQSYPVHPVLLAAQTARVSLHMFETPGLFGMCMPGDVQDSIALNARRSDTQRKFDCAHEMVHLHIHRNAAAGGVFRCFTPEGAPPQAQTSPARRAFPGGPRHFGEGEPPPPAPEGKPPQARPPAPELSPLAPGQSPPATRQYHIQEAQDNAGAAELLVPWQLFLPHVAQNVADCQTPRAFRRLRGYLADVFGTTLPVISLRFEDLAYEIQQYLAGTPLNEIRLLSRTQQRRLGIAAPSLNAQNGCSGGGSARALTREEYLALR